MRTNGPFEDAGIAGAGFVSTRGTFVAAFAASVAKPPIQNPYETRDSELPFTESTLGDHRAVIPKH